MEEICQQLLENTQVKIEYLKNTNKNQYAIQILHQAVVEEIKPKLKQYITVSDFYCVLDND